jgi:hypothetical protein
MQEKRRPTCVEQAKLKQTREERRQVKKNCKVCIKNKKKKSFDTVKTELNKLENRYRSKIKKRANRNGPGVNCVGKRGFRM